MLTAKDYVLIAGVVVLCFGLGCLPGGANAERDLSRFNNLADTGALFSIGLTLIAVGLCTVALALLLPFLHSTYRRLSLRSNEQLGRSRLS